MSLLVSNSGVRGIIGESLTPEVILKYVSAFADFCRGGKIIVGRDGRVTGKVIGNLAVSTLLAKGCDVIALSVAPTATIGIAVEQLHAAGGISITACHNPMEWNGLTFIGPSGMLLTAEECRRLESLADRPDKAYAPWKKFGRHLVDDSFLRQHMDMVMNLPYVRPEVIRQRKFKVVVDCIHAAGGVIVPFLLRELGCDVIEMNCDLGGIFSRDPDPSEKNLSSLAQRVRAEGADLGIAVDPDVDRLALITEQGEQFGQENIVTAVVQFVLNKLEVPANKPPVVVVNLATTKAVDDVARPYGARVVRTPVGEINVATRMKDVGAVVGGEGDGGVILPAIHYGRDAVAGIGLILQQLAEFGGTLSAFKETLPAYAIVRSDVQLADEISDRFWDSVRTHFGANGNADMTDGLKIDLGDSSVHLRTAGTNSLIRIVSEAPTEEGAQQLVDRFTEFISST